MHYTKLISTGIGLGCTLFDALFERIGERVAFPHYLIGPLLPREHNNTVIELAAIVSGATSVS